MTNLEKQIKQDLRNFPINWKSKLAGALSSFVLGVGLGAIGKHINQEWIPAVPIAMDLVGGMSHAKAYLCYGAGVAMNYLPEIYQVYQNMQNFGG